MTINKVIENGYCVGCGACTLGSSTFTINLEDDGFLRAKNGSTSSTTIEKSRVCPFSDDAKDENVLAENRYSNLENFDDRVGYYKRIFTGKDKNVDLLSRSSSGGLLSWFAEKLLLENEIDAVIHVGVSGDSQENELFSYRISSTVEELRDIKNRKSRYYPVSYDKVIQDVLISNKRYLFVGIPCFVKSIRLLQEENKLNNIVYTFSLLCGHMKSALFSQCLAWQTGVEPNRLNSIDFRIKNQNAKANDYDILVEDCDGDLYKKKNSQLLGAWWGHGFFRHQSCDFCDDIAGELADATFGDAWLPEYINESSGRNIVLLRNEKLNSIAIKYRTEVDIVDCSVEDFYLSQAGNYRNRRHSAELKMIDNNWWYPRVRDGLCHIDKIPLGKRKLYMYRTVLSKKSSKLFPMAKKYGKFQFFVLMLTPYLVKYDIYNSDYKGAFKRLLPLNTLKRLLKNE